MAEFRQEDGSASSSAPPAADVPFDGHACPACGRTRNRVLFTRSLPGQILRTRKCLECPRRFRTSERIVATNVPARRGGPALPAAA